jgi:ATP synthase subunit 6
MNVALILNEWFDIISPLEQYKIPSFSFILASFIPVEIISYQELSRSLYYGNMMHYCTSPVRLNFLWQLYLVSFLMSLKTNKQYVKFYKSPGFLIKLFAIFYILLFINLCGVCIFGEADTVHYAFCAALACLLLGWWCSVGFHYNGMHFLAFFLPLGSPLALCLLIVPIEVLSFIFRAVSLSTRLFANIMAGHTLIKIIATFAWNFLKVTGLWADLGAYICLFLSILIILEFGVAVIQAYIFFALANMYFEDIRFIF